MDKVIVSAPAKINFTLDITGKLSNGYHTVDMIMQSVNLCDKVIVEKNSSSVINLTCDKQHIPCNESNTAYKAVVFFSEYIKKECNVNIHIEKNIPSQAGLAGGSADGAGVLVALNKIFETNLSLDELAVIGAKIGADVPFCLYGGTMLATGIGTDLKRINHNTDLCNYSVLLCKPLINVSTPEAYKKFDNREYTKLVHSKKSIEYLTNGNISKFFQSLYNDFDSLLMLEEVQKIKSIMNENSCIKSVMSGSGPTVYGIYKSKEQAQYTADILSKIYNDVFIVNTIDSGCTII